MKISNNKCVPLKVIALSMLFICGILMLSVSALAVYGHYEYGTTSLALAKLRSAVITHVNVLTMDSHNLLYDQTIVVRDGWIETVQPASAAVPADLPVIEGRGRYVMPGLIDLHVHVLDRSYAKSALAAGVTTVRNMGGYNYQLKWRDELNNGEWYGSRLVLSSPIFNSIEQGDPMSHFRVNNPQRARQAVQAFIAAGYDFIKVYEGLHAEVYEAILQEAAALGVAVAGHPSYDLMQQNLTALGHLRSFEHTEEVFDGFLQQQKSPKKLVEAADFLKAHKIILVPTLAVNQELTLLSTQKQAYLDNQDLAAINPFAQFVYEQTSFKRWLAASPELGEYNQQVDDYLRYITLNLYQRGVVLGLGSDAGALVGVPGPATIREIMLMIDAGIPITETLRSATVNAAEVLGKSTELGRIKPGFSADLLLLSANPEVHPETLLNPELVMQQGRAFTEDELVVLRREGREHSGLLVSAVRHLSYLFF